MVEKLQKHSALLCALILAVCILAVWPVAETGMHDDWSYVRTAQVLAQTGHVVYNGWGAPMLGFQLLPAALLMKIFGFSFTLARLTTIATSLITVAMLQRTIVLCGVNDRNASIASLTWALSPVCLPVSTCFLSDIPSTLAIVICLYGCLRALQSTSDTTSSRWIWFAVFGNALIGSSRQIAWLGLLVMVPCALWLVRGRRRVLFSGAIAVVLGGIFVLVAMHWFGQHSYILPESFRPVGFLHALLNPTMLIRPLLEIPMLSLPILLLFIPGWEKSTLRTLAIAAVVVLGVCGWLRIEAHHHQLWKLAAPIMTHYGDIWSAKGVYNTWPVWGERPEVLPLWARTTISVFTLASLLGWLTLTLHVWRKPPLFQQPNAIAHRKLMVLLLPFTCAYAYLLLPRALRGTTIDRYLLPLMLVALILLTRQYQERVCPRLNNWSVAAVILMAFYSVASLQDAFGAYRAVLLAGKELNAAGIPRERFDGGWEYDGLSQIDAGVYIHQSGIRMPKGEKMLYGHRRWGPCEIPIDVWIPNVEPEYALAYTADGCGGATPFAPVSYTRWYTHRTVTFYVVRDPDLTGLHGLFPCFQISEGSKQMAC